MKRILTGCLCILFSISAYTQTTLFLETFKDNGYYDGPASSYPNYDNPQSMFSTDVIRVQNFEPSAYTGASGGSFLWLGQVQTEPTPVIRSQIVISGINTTGYSAIKLAFGAGTWYGIAATYMEIAYSINGTDWTILDDENIIEGSYGNPGWGWVRLGQNLPVTENLRIRFKSSSNDQTVRLDDIRITGMPDDNIPPSVPTSLTYSDLTYNSLILKWDASSDNMGVASYEVYSGSKLMANPNGTQALLSGLTPASNILLKVRSVDIAGNKSDFCPEISIDIPEMPADITYPWEVPQAQVMPDGDLQWKPLPFEYKPGASIRYIDYENGDDNNDGLSKSTPWKRHPWDPAATGISKSTSGVHTYVFKRGVAYRGTLTALESGQPGNPIRLTSDPEWGSGEAMFFGSRRLTGGWVKADASVAPNIPERDKVWYQTISGTMTNTKVIVELSPEGMKRVRVARTPNYKYTPEDPLKSWYSWTYKSGFDDVNKNLWLGDSKNMTQNDPAYYAGGSVWSQEDVIVMCTVWKQNIKSYDPATRRIAVPDGNFGGPGCKYFVENTPFMLDTTSEFWYDNANKRLFLRLDEDKDPNSTTLEVAVTGKLITITGKENIEISGLHFGFTTADQVRYNANDGIAVIHLTGTCKNIVISNNLFTYVNGGISANNASSPTLGSENILVSDNDMYVVDDMAIAFNGGGSYYYEKVKILRNRVYDNGGRHLGRWYSSIPAIWGQFIDAEIAGNIVDVSWGNGLDFFWGKGSSDGRTVPFVRGFIHHNKVSNTLIGTNDYGGIESWQGGPVFCYNNISHNATGYKHYNNSSIGEAFYFDGSFKHYVFNNIASAESWNRSSSAYMQVLGFYNFFVHNTAYRIKTMFNGASGSLKSNGYNNYLGNLSDSVSIIFNNRPSAVNVPYDAYLNNISSKTPFSGGFIDGMTMSDLETFKTKFETYKPRLPQVGYNAYGPILPNAGNYDFKPLASSEAIDKGVDFFIPYPLYAVVGEWHFFRQPSDTTRITAENFYFTNEYSDRLSYQNVPKNHLKTYGLSPAANYSKGILEDWISGALNFNGTTTYCTLTHTASAGTVSGNVDMTTNSFIVEAVFRTSKNHSGGVLAAKYPASGNGYQLDIDSNGKPRLSLMVSGTAAYTVSAADAVNDSLWHHVLAEVNRSAQTINLYVDGKSSNGSLSGTMPAAGVSLANNSDFFIGKNINGSFFSGTIDFVRLSKGTLTDARTTIHELYKWQMNGPFKRDFTGSEPIGKRDAGAIESGEKTCSLSVSELQLEFSMGTGSKEIAIDAASGFEVVKTTGSFFSYSEAPGTLTVTVQDNSGSALTREGEIVLAGCNEALRIPVLQEAAPCEIMTLPDTLTFTSEGGTQTAKIIANSPVSVKRTASFITIKTNATSDTVTVTVAVNNSKSRMAYVTVSGCMIDSLVIFQQAPVGLEFPGELSISTYPNPVTEGLFTLLAPGIMPGARLSIHDLTGKIVANHTLNTDKELIRFEGEKGLYILKVTDSRRTAVTRLVVE